MSTPDGDAISRYPRCVTAKTTHDSVHSRDRGTLYCLSTSVDTFRTTNSKMNGCEFSMGLRMSGWK